MIKVKEQVETNGFTLKGNIPDILAFLEREQERCPKIGVLQYIRKRRLEIVESQQFGGDINKGVCK